VVVVGTGKGRGSQGALRDGEKGERNMEVICTGKNYLFLSPTLSSPPSPPSLFTRCWLST